MKFSVFVSLFFLFTSCKSQPASPSLPTNPDDNSLLWEISGKDIQKSSYLFGTFHMMCKSDIQFSDNLLTALKSASEVYFEMDLDDPQNTLGAIFLMRMKSGKTLADLYSKEEYQRVETYFSDSVGMPISVLGTMKPLFLEALLYPKMLACEEEMSGVEQELLKVATGAEKNINGFETIAFQAAIFDSIPYDVQAQSLLKTIDSISEYRGNFGEMLQVYKSQNLSEIQNLFNNPDFGSIDHLDVLLDNRNENWVAQLKDSLAKKDMFIAVGAAHLVGEKGLISLLRKAGYHLRPIQNKPNL